MDKAWSRQKSDNLSRKDSRGESATAAATTECGWPNRSSAAHPSWWQQWSCLIAISLSSPLPSYSSYSTFLPSFLSKLDHRKCGMAFTTLMTKKTSMQLKRRCTPCYLTPLLLHLRNAKRYRPLEFIATSPLSIAAFVLLYFWVTT